MRTRTATIASIAGVLVAGTAAALVNTHVLAGSSSGAAAPALSVAVATDDGGTSTLPPTTPPPGVTPVVTVATLPATPTVVTGDPAATLPGSTAPGSTAAGSTAPGSTAPGSTAPGPGAATAPISYQVGAAGTVLVTTGTGGLGVADVVPATGWSVASIAEPAPDVVVVTFVDASSRVTFTARRTGDTVTTEVAAAAIAPAPTATAAPPIATGHGDDDEHEEDEHEEDEQDEADEHDDDRGGDDD